MTVNIPLALSAILDEYALPLDGVHGVAHWPRVTENGLRLAEETRANVEVLRLFAVFHDSRRVNEGTDPDHGQRAADFAAELRGNMFDLSDHDFDLLYRACADHTHERGHPDMTIRTCWDSDRLDLGRVTISAHIPKAGLGPETLEATAKGWFDTVKDIDVTVKNEVVKVSQAGKVAWVAFTLDGSHSIPNRRDRFEYEGMRVTWGLEERKGDYIIVQGHWSFALKNPRE